MIQFIIFCIFPFTLEYDFIKIFSYQYSAIDLEKSDGFFEYNENN